MMLFTKKRKNLLQLSEVTKTPANTPTQTKDVLMEALSDTGMIDKKDTGMIDKKIENVVDIGESEDRVSEDIEVRSPKPPRHPEKKDFPRSRRMKGSKGSMSSDSGLLSSEVLSSGGSGLVFGSSGSGCSTHSTNSTKLQRSGSFSKLSGVLGPEVIEEMKKLEL